MKDAPITEQIIFVYPRPPTPDKDAVPDGWVLVPKSPTRHQLDEAHNGPLLAGDETMDAKTEEWLIDMYSAFVRAAPKQER